MVVGQVASHTDLLVIGGGPGGYVAALRGAAAGLEVTLVERDRVGGTCLNVGCIPSKALIEVANVVATGAEASAWGVDVSSSVDMKRVQAHLRGVVDGLTSGVSRLLETAGVDVVAGTANFATPQRVAIEAGADVGHVDFDHAVVATGSRPVELPGLAFDGARVIDSTGALALDQVPERMAIVGGGYIGVELGTAWAKLGAKVTIVEALGRVLPEMARTLGAVVKRRLGALGVEIRTQTSAVGVDDAGLHVGADGTEEVIETDVVVVAVGRRPNSDTARLEAAGVTVGDGGFVAVEPDRSAGPHTYAIGDLTEGPALAHKATAEAEVAVAAVLGQPAAFDPAVVPAVVFSDPEIVTVGATVEDATAAGAEPTKFRFPLGASARAQTLAHTTGFIEVVADGDGTVIGAHLAGPHVSELAGEAALAVEMAATLDDLAGTIHPHPTLSEGLVEAALGALGRPLHVARPRRD